MVSIYMDGEDKTGKISNWEIRAGSQGELMLVCYFPSGKSYTRPLSKCEIIPTEQLQGNFFVRKGGVVFSAVDKAVIYGGKYVVVQYPGNSKKTQWMQMALPSSRRRRSRTKRFSAIFFPWQKLAQRKQGQIKSLLPTTY